MTFCGLSLATIWGDTSSELGSFEKVDRITLGFFENCDHNPDVHSQKMHPHTLHHVQFDNVCNFLTKIPKSSFENA